jgi:hypothetical protein
MKSSWSTLKRCQGANGVKRAWRGVAAANIAVVFISIYDDLTHILYR